MSNTILIKKSGTANAVPLAGDLAYGELAINYADGNLFYKNSAGGGTVTVIASNKFLSVSGNVTAANVTASGIVNFGSASNIWLGSNANIHITGGIAGQQLATDGNGQLYWTDGGSLSNGTSNIAIYENGNIALSVGGVSNVAVFTSTGEYVTGFVSATGNVNGGNINTAGTISATGNGTFGNLSTAGSGGNISGANVIFSTTMSATGNVNGGNILTSGQVSTSGNITGGNVLFGSGQVSGTGNITAGYFFGNGSQLTGVAASSVNANNLIGNTLSSNVLYSSLTSVGTLSTLSVSGSVTGGNLYTGGEVSATGTVTGGDLATAGTVSAGGNITGDNLLTGGIVSAGGNITGGNISTTGSGGNISGANVISGTTLSATANVVGGNITTGGEVSATANITGGNISTAGNVTASYYFGNGSQLTGIDTTSIQNGTSNVKIATPNGNVSIGVNNTPNVVVFADSGEYINGVLSASGNVTSGNVNTGGLVTATGNITGGNVLTGGLISATGNVTGGNVLFGSGIVSGTGNIYGGNIISGNAVIGNIEVSGDVVVNSLKSNTYVSATGNVNSGNVLTGGLISASANITGGNLYTGGLVSATGNATAGNLITGGQVIATANVSGGNITTGGQVSATGNVNGGNINTGGNVIATGNVNGGNVNTNNLVGAGLTITSAGDLNLEPTGNVVLTNNYINGVAYPQQDQDAASKLYVDNMASTGLSFHQAVYVATTDTLANITGGTITYNQPNGAANGVGATLTTTGTFNIIDSANVQTAGIRILVKNQANAVQNGVYVWSNATVITRSVDTDQYGPDSTEQLSLNDYFFVSSGNVNLGSAYVVSAPPGTITFGTSNIEFSQFSQSQVYNANTQAGIQLNGQTFNAKVDNISTSFDGSGNIVVKPSAQLTTPNIGAATGTSLSLTGTATVGNVNTGGTVSATGNVTGGNVLTGGLISATGNITGGNLSGTSITGTLLTNSQPNINDVGTLNGLTVAATILSDGIRSRTGADFTVSANGSDKNVVLSPTGSGNVTTAANISAAGNVIGSYFIGNGSQLTGVVASSSQFPVTAGTSNINGVTNGNISIAVNSTPNIAVFADSGVFVTGVTSASGNITGGNLLTGGLVSATANVTGGNLITGGLINATGNITGGNISTTGIATIATATITTFANVTATTAATSNITGALRVAGGVGVTGNVYADNMYSGGDSVLTTTSTVDGGTF